MRSVLFVALIAFATLHGVDAKKKKKDKPKSGDVETLTDKNFAKKVDASERFWAVAYGDAAANSDELRKAAQALRGVAKVGFVDTTAPNSAELAKKQPGAGLYLYGSDKAGAATKVEASTAPEIAAELFRAISAAVDSRL